MNNSPPEARPFLGVISANFPAGLELRPLITQVESSNLRLGKESAKQKLEKKIFF